MPWTHDAELELIELFQGSSLDTLRKEQEQLSRLLTIVTGLIKREEERERSRNAQPREAPLNVERAAGIAKAGEEITGPAVDVSQRVFFVPGEKLRIRAPKGEIDELIRRVLRARPGLMSEQIADEVRELKPDFKRASLHSALYRMTQNGQLVREGEDPVLYYLPKEAKKPKK